MNLPTLPRLLWLGLALIVLSSLGHLWLEIDRGVRVAPQLTQGPDLISHTHEVISTLQGLDRTMQVAEREQRNYLITEDAADLRNFEAAVAAVPGIIAKARKLTADNEDQQRRLLVIERILQARIAELRRAASVAQARGFAAARGLVAPNATGNVQASDEAIDAAIGAERALLAERLARAAEFERQARMAALGGGTLALVVLALGVGLVLVAFVSTVRLQKAQHEDAERFRMFVKGVTDYAIYPIDAQGNVTDWNAGAERIKGYRADELLGRSFSTFDTEEDRNAGLPMRALGIAAKEGTYEAEGWRVRKDGTRFLANVIIDAIRDSKGNLLGFTKVTRDVSALRQSQEALAQYAKIDALGQLTGGIAHDFNNLIHVIKNGVQLVENKLPDADPDLRKYLDLVKRNADRAASLTQRLLAFSRRQILAPKAINPRVMISDVTTLLRQALGEGISIETVMDAGAWWLSADPSQLDTAILNLALNARDAMPGGGKLTIEVSNAFLDESYASRHQEVKAGQYVMIAVSDTGTGMTKEVLAKAFDPFFTTKEIGHGTGLGLSQVYGFAKQSGGHAKIYTEPGAGTTVKLYLPRAVEPPDAVIEQQRDRMRETRGGTILLVEDDADVREFTGEVLRHIGYRVIVAGDGASALRLLDSEPSVDLLFTDVGLPNGMNGRQLATAARERCPGLKVLFTTGYTRNAIIHHGRLDPDVEVISKPFTQSSLAEKVRRILERGD
jgi:PAS domain S-box-containing protein